MMSDRFTFWITLAVMATIVLKLIEGALRWRWRRASMRGFAAMVRLDQRSYQDRLAGRR